MPEPPAAAPQTQKPPQPPAPDAKRAPGTFEYDGGPKSPVPLPKVEEGPVRGAPKGRSKTANERQVSHTEAPAGRWVYPAYGEKAHRER